MRIGIASRCCLNGSLRYGTLRFASHAFGRDDMGRWDELVGVRYPTLEVRVNHWMHALRAFYVMDCSDVSDFLDLLDGMGVVDFLDCLTWWA